MSLHRFFCDAVPLRTGNTLSLPPTEAAHALRVLRLKPGDSLGLLNGKGQTAIAELLPPPPGKRPHDAVCLIRTVTDTPAPRTPVRLYVAPPKSRNMELVLKAATELGVSVITPLICHFGVSGSETTLKPTWFDYLRAAAKQSGNPWLPNLTAPATVAEALAADDSTVGYFGAVPRETDSRPHTPWDRPGGTAALWIGPEGGFSDTEEQALRNNGCRPLTVGHWILRVETAVTALLACLQYRP